MFWLKTQQIIESSIIFEIFLLIKIAFTIVWYLLKAGLINSICKYKADGHSAIKMKRMNENLTSAHLKALNTWSVQISCTVRLITVVWLHDSVWLTGDVMTQTIHCLPEAAGLLLIYQKPVPGPGLSIYNENKLLTPPYHNHHHHHHSATLHHHQ